MSNTMLTADGAAQVAAALTDTIIRARLAVGGLPAGDMHDVVIQQFHRCLDEVTGSNGRVGATLDQIRYVGEG